LLNKVDKNSLNRAAQTLGEDFRGWRPNLEHSLALARLLLKTNLCHAGEALQELVSLSADDKIKIRDLIAPAWVDWRAVRTIPEIITGPAHERCIAVNGSKMHTLRMYILRASGLPTSGGWHRIELQPGLAENPVEMLVYEISEYFKGKFQMERHQVIQRLKNPEFGSRIPVFLLFPTPEPDKDLLSELRSALPAVTFFVLSGDYIPPSTVSKISGARFLTPALQRDQEENAENDYLDAKFIFPQNSRGRNV
jgi:hypothetical protein